METCPRCRGEVYERNNGRGDHWIVCSTCGQKGPNSFAPWSAWRSKEWRKSIDSIEYKIRCKSW